MIWALSGDKWAGLREPYRGEGEEDIIGMGSDRGWAV